MVLILCTSLCGCNSHKNYEDAKNRTVIFFANHQSKFEEAVNTALGHISPEEFLESTQGIISIDFEINGIDGIYYNFIDTSEIVNFECGSQGFPLGSQYWGIYYPSDVFAKKRGKRWPSTGS